MALSQNFVKFLLWTVLLKKIYPSRTNKYVIPVRLHKSARLNNFKPTGLVDWSVIIFSPLFSCHFHYFTYGWISWLSVLCKNKFPQIKITAQIFPAKNLLQRKYCMLWLKFTTQEYSTKKSCLFNHNWSLFFRKILTHT